MFNRGRSIPLWVCIVLTAGCATSTNQQTTAQDAGRLVEQIDLSMSLGDFQSAFDRAVKASPKRGPEAASPPRHWWTTSSGGREVILLVGHVNPGSPFWFLFIDRRLERILPADSGTNYPNHESVDAATHATPLTIQEFRERSQSQLESYQRALAMSEPNIVLAPFMLFDRSGRDRELYISLMDQYDATRLRLGDTMQESNAQFGGAISVFRDARQTILTYGGGIDDRSFAAPFVSVGFANDAVVWIETRYGGPRPDGPPRRTYE